MSTLPREFNENAHELTPNIRHFLRQSLLLNKKVCFFFDQVMYE